MSNLDKEKDYDNMTDALQFVFNQLIKDIWVSIPGIIETYDSGTKRCTVKPAINIRLTDGTTEPQTSIVNVPVMWPSGGGFVLLSPLPAGTPVDIEFSQRGITKFKETFQAEDPGSGIFNKEDARVRPGYGALSVSPATGDGISMQSEDGANYIFVENGDIEITSTAKITANSPEVIVNSDKTTLNCPDITINGSVLNIIANILLTGNITMSGLISGPLVFGGVSGEVHAHTQGIDSNTDTQQKTNGPS